MHGPSSLTRRSRWRPPAAAIAVAAVFAVKLVVLLQLQRHPLLQPAVGLDTSAYVELAREVVRGDLASGTGLYVVPPLYIYFLALILWLSGSLVWIPLVQVTVGTAAVALVFRTAGIWYGRRAAWFASGLAASAGIFTFYEALLLPAALDPFLTALSLYLLAVALNASREAHRAAVAPLAGVSFGLLALNRPNVLLAAAGLTLLLLVARRWRTAVPFAAGILVSLLPIMARNYVVARDLTPVSSHGGLSFYVGNNAKADGTYRMVDEISPSIPEQRDEARQVAERAIGRTLDDSEVSAHFYGLAWKWILAEPGRAVRLFLRKLMYAFNAGHPSLSYSYSYYVHDERTLLRYLPVGPWLLVPLGILGIWLGRDRAIRRSFALWAAFIPLCAVSLAAFFVSSSSRLPLLVPLCATAGGAIDAMARMTAAPSRPLQIQRAAVVFAVLAMLALFANWPVGLDEGRAEERTRMALWLVGQERYDEAEARVASIEPGYPDPRALHFRIGRALVVRRKYDAAIRHLERAHALDPTRAETDFALGEALLEARRPKEAIPHLQRALDAGVRPDVAGFDLARAHGAVGDRAGALRVLQAVRPFKADDGESWRAMGGLALELQAPRLAEAFLRQAVRVQPASAENFEQLGLAIALSGRYEEAVGTFEHAVRLDPRDPSALLNLAVAYAETGRAAEARRYAEEALRLDPGYERARQLLGALAKKSR